MPIALIKDVIFVFSSVCVLNKMLGNVVDHAHSILRLIVKQMLQMIVDEESIFEKHWCLDIQ